MKNYQEIPSGIEYVVWDHLRTCLHSATNPREFNVNVLAFEEILKPYAEKEAEKLRKINEVIKIVQDKVEDDRFSVTEDLIKTGSALALSDSEDEAIYTLESYIHRLNMLKLSILVSIAHKRFVLDTFKQLPGNVDVERDLKEILEDLEIEGISEV